MSNATQKHPAFERVEELFDNMDVWDKPTEIDEITTRKVLESEIIDYTFSGEPDIQYRGGVKQNRVTPKMFLSTDRITVKPLDYDEEYGESYLVKAKISDLNPEPNEVLSIYFEGYVSEIQGIKNKEPIIIRKG